MRGDSAACVTSSTRPHPSNAPPHAAFQRVHALMLSAPQRTLASATTLPRPACGLDVHAKITRPSACATQRTERRASMHASRALRSQRAQCQSRASARAWERQRQDSQREMRNSQGERHCRLCCSSAPRRTNARIVSLRSWRWMLEQLRRAGAPASQSRMLGLRRACVPRRPSAAVMARVFAGWMLGSAGVEERGERERRRMRHATRLCISSRAATAGPALRLSCCAGSRSTSLEAAGQACSNTASGECGDRQRSCSALPKLCRAVEHP